MSIQIREAEFVQSKFLFHLSFKSRKVEDLHSEQIFRTFPCSINWDLKLNARLQCWTTSTQKAGQVPISFGDKPFKARFSRIGHLVSIL